MSLCEICGERPATIFLTKIVGNKTTERRMCEQCAHDSITSAQALLGDMDFSGQSPDTVMQTLFDQAVAAGLITPEEAEELKNSNELTHLQIEEVHAEEMLQYLNELGHPRSSDDDEDDESLDETPDDADDEIADGDLSNGEEVDNEDVPSSGIDFDEMLRKAREEQGSSRSESFVEHQSKRCPKCGMTWDRLKQDGRAGCAQCYTTFTEDLRGVMQKMQRDTHHIGKEPRAAQKRMRRLKHLRARRDHQLELLQRRLEESIANERYEEAAKLRDKIKVVSSTIVQED
jgi:protein arginine kinase activator